MRVRSWLPGALAAILCTGIAPAWADGDVPFETAGGYSVVRVTDPGNLEPCRMTREYKDPKDNNAANALSFGRMGEDLVISLAYERWKWEEGKSYRASLAIDAQVVDKDLQWIGEGVAFVTKVPVAVSAKLGKGKRIVLGFKDGNADFDLGGFAPAYASLLRCDAAATSPAASSAPLSAASPIASPAAPSNAPAKAPSAEAPLPSEDRAVAYLFTLYDRWAFEACDLPTTSKQRQAFDAKAAALKPEMSAVEAEMLKQVPSDPKRCPPTEVLRKQVQLLTDNAPEAFVAKLEPRVREEFAGIVKPILARLRPPAAETKPAGGGAQAALPSEARVTTYYVDLTAQDLIARCDMPTTAKQRTGLDAKIAALRGEMTAVEAAVRQKLTKEPCPEGQDRSEIEKQLPSLLTILIERSPEDIPAAVTPILGEDIGVKGREILATVKPNEARMFAYLWGLILRDKLARCDLASTTKQRASLEAKIASLQPEMVPYEAALREQIKARFDNCPNAPDTAEWEATLARYLDTAPETFAAEMDEKAKQADGKAAGGTKDEPAPTSGQPSSYCGDSTFPQTRAQLIAALKERLKPLGVTDIVEGRSLVASQHRYALKNVDVGIDLDESNGKIITVYIRQDGDAVQKEFPIVLASASYVVATFDRAPEDRIAGEVKARLGAGPASAGRSEKFGTATVFYTKGEDGHAAMLIDNADAKDCKR